MAEGKQISVQLWINCFNSKKVKSQNFFKKLKEHNIIHIVLTVWMFLTSKTSVTVRGPIGGPIAYFSN